MLTFEKARSLADAWVRIVTDDAAAVVDTATIVRPYGWVFVYQSKAYLASGRSEDRLAGNAPLIVDRYDGEVRVTGTARALDTYLSEYEATLPPARLIAR